MNPPGTTLFPIARFPWSKGVPSTASPDTLRSGSSGDLAGGGVNLPPLPDSPHVLGNTGIAIRSAALGRRTGVWVGRWAGPVLFLALLSGGLFFVAPPAGADDWSRGSGGILSDGLPRYTQPLRDPAPDLSLNKPNQRVADALASFAVGLAAEENADFERALEAYQQALSLDASNTELAVKVAFTLARQGQIPQGIDILKDAEKASPKDLLPPLCLSQIYGKFLKKPKLAERYALKALRLEPGNIGPYLALYEIYRETGEKAKATDILKKAAEYPTKDPLFRMQLVEMRIQEVKAGLPQGAGDENVRFPPEQAKEIAPLVKRALEGNEDDIPTLIRAADAYILIGYLGDAAPIYQRVVEKTPTPDSEEMQQVRENLARCLLAGATPEAGLEVLRRLIRDVPTRMGTYELLAEWYSLMGETETSMEIYRQALEVDGSQAKYHLRIAQIQAEQEKTDDAVKTLVAARRQFPQQAFVTYMLGQMLLHAERYPEALKIFAEAQQEGRYSNDEVLSAEFYFYYGMAAERSGDLDLAAQCLRRSIELDPTNAAQAYNYLGYMWADQGIHLEEARELILLALQREPENAAYLDSLGWVYYRMKKYPQAIEYLTKALERMNPEEAVLFDHLGDALHAVGRTQEAVEQWKKALSLEPGNEEIQKKLAAPAETSGAPAVLTGASSEE